MNRGLARRSKFPIIWANLLIRPLPVVVGKPERDAPRVLVSAVALHHQIVIILRTPSPIHLPRTLPLSRPQLRYRMSSRPT